MRWGTNNEITHPRVCTLLLEHRNVKAITLLKCYNITTEQHWDLITTIRITIRIFP